MIFLYVYYTYTYIDLTMLPAANAILKALGWLIDQLFTYALCPIYFFIRFKTTVASATREDFIGSYDYYLLVMGGMATGS